MMSLLIGFLTIVLVLDCVFLVFLVLLQLPKKEAGAGMAFGGAATDALFGAGSGNVLTKVTTYVAGAFFVLTLLLSVLASMNHKSGGTSLTNALTTAPATVPAAVPASAPAAKPVVSTNTSTPLLTVPTPATNK